MKTMNPLRFSIVLLPLYFVACAVINPFIGENDSFAGGSRLTVTILQGERGNIIVESTDIVKAIVDLTDPVSNVQTKIWVPSNSVVFYFNTTRPGIHNFKLTDIDTASNTNISSTNFSLRTGYNYRVTVILGGVIQCEEITEETYDPGPGWVLAWNDEFSQTTLNSDYWTYDIGTGPNGDGWGNNESEYYTARTNNIRIENGKLIIQAWQESYGGRSYTSARIKTKDKRSWTYGKIVARIKMPYGKGIWPAFWMLGTNFNNANWPGCGEIDIAEMVGGVTASNSTLYGSLFWTNSGTVSFQRFTNIGEALADKYHTYEIEWNSAWMKVRIDQKDFFFYDIGSPVYDLFRKPFFILLNLAVGGLWPGYPDGSTVFPQTMLIDWVRVYQRDATIPVLNVSYPQDDVTLYGVFPLRAAAESSNAIEGIYLSVDNGAFTRVTNTNFVSHGLNLTAGAHNLRCYARDVSNKNSITNDMDITVTWQKPVVTFTTMPAEGSSDLVRGNLSGVTPSMYKISLQIFAYWLGWWVKPTSTMPYTPVNADGSWSSIYVSGGVDSIARAMKAYVIPSYVDTTTNMISNAVASVFSNRIDSHAHTAYVIDPNSRPPYAQKFNDFTNGSTVYTTNGSIYFNGWAVDAARDGAPNFVLFSIDNSPFTNTNYIGSYYQEWSFTRLFTAGAHVLKAYKKDNGFGIGETNTMNFNVVIDAVRPAVQVISPTNGQNVSGSTFTMTGTASDNQIVKKVVFNWFLWHDWGTGPSWSGFGSPEANGTTSWSYTFIPGYTGTNLIEIYSVDMAGNESPRITNIVITY